MTVSVVGGMFKKRFLHHFGSQIATKMKKINSIVTLESKLDAPQTTDTMQQPTKNMQEQQRRDSSGHMIRERHEGSEI